LLYLHHRRAFAGRVGRFDLFRHHAVEVAADFVEPLFGDREVGRGRGEAHAAPGFQVRPRESLDLFPSLSQRQREQ
jgi:hypothetical protein